MQCPQLHSLDTNLISSKSLLSLVMPLVDHSNEVLRLTKAKVFKLNALSFQSLEGVVAPILSFKSCLGDNWTSARKNTHKKRQSEVGSKVEGIRFSV